MSIDYSIYIGAVAVCRGPKWLGDSALDEWLEDEIDQRLMVIEPMCGDAIVEGATTIAPNSSPAGLRAVWIDGRPDTGVTGLPTHSGAINSFQALFANELDGLRELFRSVDVQAGIFTWAS